ncbi:MAG: hypothetical protein AAGI71_05745 [Bacteroidota bacterium]
MKLTRYSLVILMVAVLAGCQDLSVENPNNPDRALALATPGDVENLVGGTFLDYWSATQWCAGSMMFATIADEHSCSWANWAMRDMSSEPRIAWNNDPSYSREEATEDPWFNAYVGISNSIDGLLAIADAEATGGENNIYVQEGVDTERLRAFAKFTMGLSHSRLAMQFDQAFIVDETVDLEAVALGVEELPLSDYNTVAAAAIGFLDEAIAIAQANDFTITAAEDWIFGLDITNQDLIKLANSYAARILAQTPRTPEERAAVDWNEVMRRIDNGITEDFAPIGNDDGDDEWDCMKFYGQTGTTWARADYRSIGPADENVCDPNDDTINCFEEWVNTPLQDRLVFDIKTSDRRIVGSDDDLTISGKYFEYQGNNGPFPASRGTYHFSTHNPSMHQAYNTNDGNGPMVVMNMAEMDMLMAEALLRTGGSTQTVADLLNVTRIANGELAPATADNAVGTPDDSQSHRPDATLWAMLKHEKRMETFHTASGLAFFDDRGWGDLVDNTPFHFPVPGAELETLALQTYTFGGGGAASASSNGSAWKAGERERRGVSGKAQRLTKPI